MPFVDDYTKTTYVNEDVQPTGTPDLSAANLNNNENGVKELYTALSTLYTSLEALETEVAGIGTSYEDTTFISGLQLEWVSNTQVRITSGAAYIPAAGLVAQSTSSTTLTPSVAASTIYYLYAINIGGTLSYQFSTTVPVLYRGSAKHKTGDSSQRYIGSFRTNASSQIVKFRTEGGGHEQWVNYLVSVNQAPLLVLSDGRTSASAATVSCSSVVPTTSTMAWIQATQQVNVGAALGNSEMVGTLDPDSSVALSVSLIRLISVVQTTAFKMPLAADQSLTYRMRSDPGSGNGLMLSVTGYLETR